MCILRFVPFPKKLMTTKKKPVLVYGYKVRGNRGAAKDTLYNEEDTPVNDRLESNQYSGRITDSQGRSVMSI